MAYLILNTFSHDTWPPQNSPPPFSWAASTPPRTTLFFSIRHQATAERCTHQTMPVQQPSHSPTCCQGRPPNSDPAESAHVVLSSSRFATSNKSTTTIKSKVDVPKICIQAVYGFEIQKTNDSRVVSHVITNDSLGSKA